MTDLASDAVTLDDQWPDVHFGPRRLGHVNMYVSDLERSFAFYHDVCGLELVFDEPGIFAKFLSNGNSHHDIAITAASDKTLVGRDGKVQKSAERGSQPGLNHMAFEMATEAELVAGIRRTQASGYTIHSLYDHQISRSAYLPDPNGVEVEMYADSSPDWRGIYARVGTELLSSRWEPESEGPANDQPQYVQDFWHRPVPGAPARPLRTARAMIVVPDLEGASSFYQRLIGLQVLESDQGEGRWAVLGGTLGRPDLYLVEARDDEKLGFHHFSLELPDVEELDATVARLQAAGVAISEEVRHARKYSAVVIDPDGVGVEFYTTGPDPAATYRSVAAASPRAYLA
jgi:catechol 2,3-dioxygenase